MSDPILFECDCCHGEGEIIYKYINKNPVECADCRGLGYVTIDKLRTMSKPRTGADFPGPICGILALAKTTHEKGMKGSIPFKIGDELMTISGNKVVCIELTFLKGYECARFDDGAWRYNREHDRGRCTGSSWDDRLNILPNYPNAEHLVPGDIKMNIACLLYTSPSPRDRG